MCNLNKQQECIKSWDNQLPEVITQASGLCYVMFFYGPRSATDPRLSLQGRQKTL